MIVAFTGTRHGMTVRQAGEVARWLNRLRRNPDGSPSTFVHGLCRGADAEAHVVARMFGYRIEGWPSTAATRGSFVDAEFTVLHVAQPPLVRNHDIIAHADVLLATPRERAEVQRSGTWATIRLARRSGLTTILVWP